MARRSKKNSRKRRNRFAGADDVYLTKKSIAVRRISTVKGARGSARLIDETTYVPKTEANLRRAKGIFGYLRFGRK